MPVEPLATGDSARRQFDFVAVDEVQLAGDRERGHIFTDRIMHARGAFETMLMGAQTQRHSSKPYCPMPGWNLGNACPSLFMLAQKLTRLPRRSAVVAFSMSDVYRIAEFVRRQRGAAVVMGRLSPRTQRTG